MIGFESLKSRMLRDFSNKKLHHGILLYGPKGCGKASFLQDLCASLLQNKGSELSDLRVINKEDGKKSISVKSVRDCQEFLNHGSAISGYKFLIVDAACELGRSAANALLKSLEEPKKDSFIFMVAHNLFQVLPTIRSRCMLIKSPRLSKEEFLNALKISNCDFTSSENDFLAEISNFAPAIAIAQGKEMIEIYEILLQVALQQKLREEYLKKFSEKNFDLVLFERMQIVFFHRLLLFRKYFSVNRECLSRLSSQESATFQKFDKASIDQLLWTMQENFSYCQSANMLNLDKKAVIIFCFENILKILV